MHIDPIKLHSQHKLIDNYRKNNKDLLDFFDYQPFTSSKQRLKNLEGRHFERERLCEVLHTMNKQWDAPESTFVNIRRLEQENSTVVIAGQQAGLLTGPLYTVNKIISVIQYAKKKEKELNVPVIPVFWIAGEDHDFEEINHVFLPDHNSKMCKHTLAQRTNMKSSVSHMQIDPKQSEQWVAKLFEQLPETEHTKDLYEMVQGCLSQSESYVDFFARIIYCLFISEGLVLIDSGNLFLRKLESSHFEKLIRRQSLIAESVYNTAMSLEQLGYQSPIGAQRVDAHLFYHKNGERILLERTERGEWRGKQNEVLFTTEELLQVAKEHPEQLSNNVVTRPLMQELLFPTLAFIGGPGEISYWAELKEAFRAIEIHMPPVIPRLSFTFIDRYMEKIIRKYDLSPDTAMLLDLQTFKEKWLADKSDFNIEEESAELKKIIEDAHQRIREIAWNIRDDIGQLSEKNLIYLHGDIDFLQKRMLKALKEKYEKELSEMDLIEAVMQPSGNLQERMWNPLPLINKHGYQFINDLVSIECAFDEEHYLVYM